ncbi:KRUF family protein, partial [Toxoplasma gondii GT1]
LLWWLSGSQPQRGRSATRRKRGSAAEASEPGQLGVARTVTLAGVGEVTYGELAITQLRRQAAALREEWGSEADFVRQKVGRLIVSQSAPPTQEQIRMWSKWALSRFRVRRPARVREAEQLERLASEILATLEKAGAHLRLSGSPSSPRPGTSEQASRTDSDGGASGTARGSPPPPTSTNDYCRTGIQQLRNQAAVMRHTYSNKDAFIARHVAARMARSENPYPRECVVREWRYQATRNYNIYAKLRTDEAAALEAQAMAWENRLTAGALTQDVPCEGTSGVTQPYERAPKPERTPGRPGALVFLNESRRQCDPDASSLRNRCPAVAQAFRLSRDPRRHRQKRQMPVEATSTAASSDPSVSSSPTAAETRGSLAGTLLGSTVELEGIGKVPYVQLAIEALSRRAAYLRSHWGNEDDYIREKIAEEMLQHDVRSPSRPQLRRWMKAARRRYRTRGPARADEAAALMNLADDLTKRAAAAGIPLRSSQENTAQAVKSGEHLPSAQGEGPSVGELIKPRQCNVITYFLY